MNSKSCRNLKDHLIKSAMQSCLCRAQQNSGGSGGVKILPTYLEDILELSFTLGKILTIMEIRPTKVEQAILCITKSFLNFDERIELCNGVTRKSACLRKKTLVDDLQKTCCMTKSEAELTVSVVKYAFHAFYHKQNPEKYNRNLQTREFWQNMTKKMKLAYEKTGVDKIKLELAYKGIEEAINKFLGRTKCRQAWAPPDLMPEVADVDEDEEFNFDDFNKYLCQTSQCPKFCECCKCYTSLPSSCQCKSAMSPREKMCCFKPECFPKSELCLKPSCCSKYQNCLQDILKDRINRLSCNILEQITQNAKQCMNMGAKKMTKQTSDRNSAKDRDNFEAEIDANIEITLNEIGKIFSKEESTNSPTIGLKIFNSDRSECRSFICKPCVVSSNQSTQSHFVSIVDSLHDTQSKEAPKQVSTKSLESEKDESRGETSKSVISQVSTKDQPDVASEESTKLITEEKTEDTDKEKTPEPVSEQDNNIAEEPKEVEAVADPANTNEDVNNQIIANKDKEDDSEKGKIADAEQIEDIPEKDAE